MLDLGGSIGRSAAWSIVVAAAAPHVPMSTATIKDLELKAPGGSQSAMAGIVCSFLVQARDMYGNANQAECLFNVQGRLIYDRLLTSQHLEHGGSSIASLHDSMRGGWPYTPETVLEDLSPVNLSAGACSEGRTYITFVAPAARCSWQVDILCTPDPQRCRRLPDSD